MSTAFKFLLPLLLIAAPAAAQPAADEAPEKAGPVTRQTASRESPLVDFQYSWPEEVASESALVAYFQADLAKMYDEATANARDNKTEMEKVNAPFHQNLFDRDWSLEGQSGQLISLVANTDTYAGGAHPNHDSSALLWDRTAGAAVPVMQLFESDAAFEAAVRPTFCKLLDAERASRREGETLDGEFAQCPAFSELTIAPARESGAGPFDEILLIADPYVAGPYVEGAYDVAVPVTPAIIAAVKPDYHAAFEVQRPQ